MFVDLFDTLGTLIGVSSKANMLDKDGKASRIKGAPGGCSWNNSRSSTRNLYNNDIVESSSGVAEGGRTGLTAVTTAVLFGLSLFLSPIFLAIPSFATAPALVIVGFYMLSAVTDINFADAAEGIPAFICIAAMPFFYSISEGISMGVLSYVFLNLLTGKAKKISPVMYVLAVLFVLKYLLI